MATTSNAEKETPVLLGRDLPQDEAVALREKYSQKGWAPVKTDFIVVHQQRPAARDEATPAQDGEPPPKRAKLKGRNKRRPGPTRPVADPALPKLCSHAASSPSLVTDCPFGDGCRYSHDLAGYMALRPADLGPECPAFAARGRCDMGVTCRFGAGHIDAEGRNVVDKARWGRHQETKNKLSHELQARLRKRQYNFERSFDVLTRLGVHIDPRQRRPPPGDTPTGGAKDKAMQPAAKSAPTTADQPSADIAPPTTDQSAADAAPPTADQSAADAAPATADQSAADTAPPMADQSAADTAPPTADQSAADAAPPMADQSAADAAPLTADQSAADAAPPTVDQSADDCIPINDPAGDGQAADTLKVNGSGGSAAPISMDHGDDDSGVTIRSAEKKQIDFSNLLYLAPLTTVGNLPFRRVCRSLGADVTCGEMAMASNLLQGKKTEWALLRRHPSETLFGVQLCGGYPDMMTKCAQMVSEQCEVDFVDVNCGCPIDLVYQRGEGSGLMRNARRLDDIVRGMGSVLDCPLTVKIRTGIFEDRNIAHTLMAGLRDSGAALVTVHGRTREQRYTRLADWEYIRQCAEAARPMPVFGNGDVLSWEDAVRCQEASGVAGVMVARGALIKPWLFTEIRERRHWDISAPERLDLLRQFANHGMEHWGSDARGLETTRRFMLEWLSFLHRYIPVGLLERLPQRINEKPPQFIGRSDLETLLSSSNCADWIKISEMLLGPVPDNFQFLPKHKANSYQAQS